VDRFFYVVGIGALIIAIDALTVSLAQTEPFAVVVFFTLSGFLNARYDQYLEKRSKNLRPR
jgi:peptidoglycan/LPS O-acetylase OafA/YrhL